MITLRRTLSMLALAAFGCARAEAQTPAAVAPSRVVFGTGTLEADRPAPLAFERPGPLRQAVSYTHMTLPTNRKVEISGVHVSETKTYNDNIT